MKNRLSYLSALIGSVMSVRSQPATSVALDGDYGYRPTRAERTAKRPPNKLTPEEKQRRRAAMRLRRAGIQGNGLWRRNAAQGRVKGH